MTQRKPLEELTLMDDYMFTQVMRETRLLKPLLEYILKVKIEKIEEIEPQKSEKEGYESRGVRLDLYVTDTEGTVYNIEVQTSDKKNLPKRMRYYQSVIDISILAPGVDYKNLRKSFIIFICNYDEFGLGHYIYTFENTCREVPGLTFGDETCKIVINTKGTKGEISSELKEVLRYLDDGSITGSYSRELDDAVQMIKTSEERRHEYMLQWVRDNEIREEGVEQGRVQEAVRLYHEELNLTGEDLIAKIMSRFSIDRATAEEYVEEALGTEENEES